LSQQPVAPPEAPAVPARGRRESRQRRTSDVCNVFD